MHNLTTILCYFRLKYFLSTVRILLHDMQAGVAQLVELLLSKQTVAGSNPVSRSMS